MTSGNISECPITITPEEAEKQLAGKIPLLLHHNRVDDSVLQVCGGQSCLIRRSRGYVPEPFFADVPVEGILAFRAEKVNTFALGKGETILQSQYIGDLKNWETFRFYKESLERFQHLLSCFPQSLVGTRSWRMRNRRRSQRCPHCSRFPMPCAALQRF